MPLRPSAAGPAAGPQGPPRAGHRVPTQPPGRRCRRADAHPARAVPGAGRPRGHAVGGVADAAQPDQHRHRQGRPHLGGRGRALPQAPRPPARGRSHRRARRTPNGDGKADSTHTFVQEPGLVAPLGVSVIDNKIVVSQPPDLIVYTDVDRNLRFDPAVDKREVLLTGFQGINHDHSLHSVTVGAGRQVGLQQRQHRRRCSPTLGQDVPRLRRLSRRPGRPVQEPARPGGAGPASPATTGTSTSAASRSG